MLRPVRPDLLVGEVRVHLDLVDRRDHLGLLGQPAQVRTWKLDTPIDRARPSR